MKKTDEELKTAYRETRQTLDGVPPTFDAIQRRTADHVSLRGPIFAMSALAIAVTVLLVIFIQPDEPINDFPELPETPELIAELPTDIGDTLAFAEWEAPTDFLMEPDEFDITDAPEFVEGFDGLEQLKEL